MTQIFQRSGTTQKAFSGAVCLTTDLPGSSPTNVTYEMPCENAEYRILDNVGYQQPIDNSQFSVNRTLGIRLGKLTLRGWWKNDRNMHTFLTNAFGPRTAGQLNPLCLALVPYAGGTPTLANGLFFNTFDIMSTADLSGSRSGIMWQAQADVIDPDNYFAATAPTLPTYAGTEGTSISSMSSTTFDNGAPSSPTLYNSITAMRLSLNNNGDPVPTPNPNAPGKRYASDWIPGPFTGNVGLTQLQGGVSALPQTTGEYPFGIHIPDSIGSKIFTAMLSAAWDEETIMRAGKDFNKYACVYSLFNTNAGNTTNGVWPFVFTYA